MRYDDSGSEHLRFLTVAGYARASIIGIPLGRKYPQTNGWTFWGFIDTDGLAKPLDELRQRYYSRGVSADS